MSRARGSAGTACSALQPASLGQWARPHAGTTPRAARLLGQRGLAPVPAPAQRSSSARSRSRVPRALLRASRAGMRTACAWPPMPCSAAPAAALAPGRVHWTSVQTLSVSGAASEVPAAGSGLTAAGKQQQQHSAVEASSSRERATKGRSFFVLLSCFVFIVISSYSIPRMMAMYD